ncbi:MAG: response regulator, partial [Alphaproteobacteria bacterium]|nr:response regulator [Alphaproteobacteria bacterium]
QISTHDYTGSRRLLIAEDTLSVQDVLKRQLNKLGIEADFVLNGIEALKVLEKKEHGILFTDLHMPEMDGYQLVAHIRTAEGKENIDMHKRFPVIALTADVQLAQRQAYLSYGFDECLLKPVSLGQFRQLLIRWGVLREEATAANIPVVSVCATDAPSSSLLPAVDKDAMISQMGAFDAEAIEMLQMFVDMTQPSIEKLEAAFAQNNTHELKETAHSLKGSARSACCPRLGDLAAEMQENAEKGQAITADMIATIKAEFERVAKEVKTLQT